MAPQTVSGWVRRRLRQAGLWRTGRGCHAFRRTFATAYLRENVGDLRGLQKLLRHDNIGTTVLYDFPQPEDLGLRMAQAFGANAPRPVVPAQPVRVERTPPPPRALAQRERRAGPGRLPPHARSSKESGARTVSLEDQRARIADYCRAQGWALVEVIADDGVSGGRRERLDRLAERVKKTGARAIVVYHVDRFARDLAATLEDLRRFARRGVELHVVGRGRVEADTATGFIVTAVEGLAAEHYRRVISEKTRDALARLKAEGRRFTHAIPYGYRVAANGFALEPEPAEQAVLGLVAQLRRAGLSLRAVAAELGRRGFAPRGCGGYGCRPDCPPRKPGVWTAQFLHRFGHAAVNR